MKAMMGAAAVLLMSAAPAAAQGADPEMQCFAALGIKASKATKAGEDSASYDNAAGFFMATVVKRYPTAERFAPALREAIISLKRDDELETATQRCMAEVQPALDLVNMSIDSLN